MFSGAAKALGIEESSQVMVPKDARIEFGDFVHALLRLGTVSDDVTQANDLLAPLRLSILDHSPECNQVSVDIADNGSTQEQIPVGDPLGYKAIRAESLAGKTTKARDIADMIE